MPTLSPIKRGDTFAIHVDLADSEEAPLLLTTDQIKCQIRSGYDKLIDTLDVALTQIDGRYLLTSSDTSSWPIGELVADIQIDIEGVITSSDDLIIPVKKDVTRDE